MNKNTNENSSQKCWYCKKNNSDSKYLNIEKEEKNEVTIKGVYKYKNKDINEWKVERCKDCFDIHQKGDVLVETISGKFSVITYVLSYILLCFILMGEGDSIKYIIFIFLAAIPTVVLFYLLTIAIGYFYAYKYNIKTRWAKGGDV